MIVADASVVLKWVLLDEDDRNKALALRKRHLAGENPIGVPDLLFYEVANVLPSRWDVSRAADLFREIHAVGMETYSFESLPFTHAIELAGHHGISAYDACYVVLAQVLRCKFVTADARLLTRLKGVPHLLHLKEVVP